MAENSSNNSSGKKGWRQRVGVKGAIPKISQEFKTEPTMSQSPPKSPPATGQNQSAPPQRPAPQPISRPAPMAPRRAPADRQTEPAPQAAAKPDFSDRLRAQRQAAEALAQKRAAETRDRLANGTSNLGGPKFSFADDELSAAKNEQKPRSPGQARTAPPRAPASAPPARGAGTLPPRPPARANGAPNPENQSGQQPQQAKPRPPFRPGQNGATPRPYQPSDAYRQTHGYRDYDAPQDAGGSAPPQQRPAQSRYAEPEAPGGGYVPPQQSSYRPPQSRSEGYGQDGPYDDHGLRPTSGDVPRRAGADDYTAAYRDYDEAFDYEEEPRRGGGMWVFLIVMLMVVAAIAAGAYWFINYGSKIGAQKNGSGGVPTITAPETPVKVAPKPVEPAAPNAPVKRKKIYDRILGDQTLEPEKLVPTEEAPKKLPQAVQPAPTNNNPIGVEPLPLPLPPPPAVPGVQGSVSQKSGKLASNATDSKPVPTSGQTSITPTSGGSQKQSAKKGGQQAPLTLPPATPEQTAGIPAPQATPAPTQPGAELPEAVQKVLPLPRKKPSIVIAQARQASEQARLAALAREARPAPLPQVPVAPIARQPQALPGTGPVQLAPRSGTSQNFGNTQRAPAPVVPGQPQAQPRTNIASLPQPTRPSAPTPQTTTGTGYVLQMSVFRSRAGATAEYRRLSSRHGRILNGLSPQIQESDLGANGKFYKLRLGRVATRTQAARLCNSLIAAGEKDCLVRNR